MDDQPDDGIRERLIGLAALPEANFPQNANGARDRLIDCLVVRRRVGGQVATAVAHLLPTPDGGVELRMALYACHISDVEAELMVIGSPLGR